MVIEGDVVRTVIAKGTKSEHFGYRLDVTKDERYQLRLRGDNPFENKGLQPFSGKHCLVKGRFVKGILLAEEIKIVES